MISALVTGSVGCGLRGRALLLLLIVLLASGGTRAQVPVWQSAIAVTESASGANSSSVEAMATDASGNVYLAGKFIGTVSFGAFMLTSTRGESVFVAKWSPVTGNFIWAEPASAYATAVKGLTVSGNSVYVCGEFYGPATFGSTTLTSSTLNTSLVDIFVAKLTDGGSSAGFDWAKQIGGTDNDFATGLATSGGSVYLAGYFQSPTVAFGPTTLTKSSLQNFSADGFLTKLTDAGSTSSFAWTQHLSGTANDNCRAVAVSGPNVYLTGSFNSPTLSLGNLSLAKVGTSYSVYVAKLTDTGTAPGFAWAQNIGEGKGEYASALAVSGSGIYLAGGFDSPVLRIGGTTLTNSGPAATLDVFLTKLTDTGSTGTVAWAQGLGGTENDYVTGLAVSGAQAYMTGYFNSANIDFGSYSLNNFGGGNGYPDIFATKITDLGSSARFDWAQQAGGRFNDQTYAAALSGTTLYTAGVVYTQASFGTISFVYPATSYVPFLAALDDATGLATTAATPLAGLSLAPNPAHTAATVHIPPVPGTTEATLTLLDGLGRHVKSQRLTLPATGATIVLPLSGLMPGFYHLQIQAGAQRTSRSLTVE
ncbi:T9SS type A sorting domain-containing protein [Microvirga sp. STS02]|uniref:T9SS type A sorting domain-containing protein n=1 Tax=Hymenobacter negativus TaxID=2795026 RepID=UPI0018DBED58|nr:MULTISPECIES: T9SS type A sorting domain-containing protein [Bacteria]MBH8567710.1 T9SS type A sorting domain-containing protein [Hymenobacter negativus]MBR7207444.1 T9SS type A sorting domain-containing protein [Microvirga sp. STS02]